ncbi:MAG: GerMN domain-containing protein [Spirochaetota bacterium]
MAVRGKGKGESGPIKGGSAGCLLWLIVFSFIFVLFVVNWGRITETLERTNFSGIVQNQRQDDATGKAAPVKPAPKVGESVQRDSGDDVPAAKSSSNPEAKGTVEPRKTEPIAVPEAPKAALQARPVAPAATAAVPASADPATTMPAGAQPSKAVRTRPATLYFVRIDDDGIIARESVKRNIPASDSPLTDALTALVNGPNADELGKHLVSLIPSGTRLMGVRVQGSTAVINLSEPFMYNHYGIEGYAGQLKQIVYTATSFSTVHDVQILVDGEKHDYLGGEGVYIGKPLSRNSF